MVKLNSFEDIIEVYKNFFRDWNLTKEEETYTFKNTSNTGWKKVSMRENKEITKKIKEKIPEDIIAYELINDEQICYPFVFMKDKIEINVVFETEKNRLTSDLLRIKEDDFEVQDEGDFSKYDEWRKKRKICEDFVKKKTHVRIYDVTGLLEGKND